MSKRSAREDVTLEFDGGEELAASSHVLCFASPVFEGMLTSGMDEARSKRIGVSKSSKAEFAIFYELLLPGAWKPSRLSKENVDGLLVLSDYYQVDFVKAGCENALMRLPATAPRLLQAHTHGLSKQYKRCVDAIADWTCKEDLKLLEKHPGVLMDLAAVMRAKMTAMSLYQSEKEAQVKEGVETLIAEVKTELKRKVLCIVSFQWMRR
mmetsp:Transcript_57940/g.116165  ORF Transcript_57940/g.116165 Transcript_57940/m.116165 type:complete len:209 (-) Transcript_57940:177-803(-)